MPCYWQIPRKSVFLQQFCTCKAMKTNVLPRNFKNIDQNESKKYVVDPAPLLWSNG